LKIGDLEEKGVYFIDDTVDGVGQTTVEVGDASTVSGVTAS